jgi:hypothetical protein
MPLVLESPGAADRRLRVVFAWQSDRYGHTVELTSGNAHQSLLLSVEGSAVDEWPPSPPLQQLHLEERPAGRVALLVGMAGRGHWSLSIDAASDGSSLVFDVACRSSSVTARLGSLYQVLGQGGQLANSGILIPTEFVCESGWKLTAFAAGTASRPKLAYEGGRVLVAPSDISLPTVRWKYRVELTQE